MCCMLLMVLILFSLLLWLCCVLMNSGELCRLRLIICVLYGRCDMSVLLFLMIVVLLCWLIVRLLSSVWK